jgi:glycosyltransferase involved in cell wall biosynthesis
MKVSVVIPVYNKGPYLLECLNSVFTQTLTDLEVIAVDDRSTDDSLVILQACTDPRLHVIARTENGGPAAAVRMAMDLAQGEYIIRMDADDISLPERFAEQVRYMDAHPELGMSGTRVVDLDRPDQERPVMLDPDACRAEAFFTVPVFQPTAIYRRSVLEQHGLGFDPAWPRIGEDWLFGILAARVTRMANLDRVLVHYRTGVQNISHGQDMHVRWAEAMKVGLPMLGLEPTPENITYHLLTKPTFLQPPDRSVLLGFRSWMDRVRALPCVGTSFPRAAFEARLERSWERLFYVLCDHDLRMAWEHLRISRGWPLDRLTYYAKVRLNALLHQRST